MQRVKIPQLVDPVHAAAKKLDYVGYVPKDKFVRLADYVEAILNDVDVKLSFGVDLQGLTVIEGSVGTAVKCICQRCGKPLNLDIKAEFRYTSDEDKAEMLGLSDDYDFAEVGEDGQVDLYKLLEDELILSMPLVPKHEEGLCTIPCGGVYGIVPEEKVNNPFAVLGKLKK